MAREVAVGKRIKIGKYQQQMILFALLAAIVLGVSIVLSVFFIKYIAFNSKVIEGKDAAIKDYDMAISNSKTLEGLVLGLADNKDLESVALGTVDRACFEPDSGKRINYSEKYRAEMDEEKAKEYLKMMKTCSALRVVPDALPSNENKEALMSSVDQIFKISGWEPESLSPSDSSSYSAGEDAVELQTMSMGFSVEANPATVFRVLDSIEKSVRSLDISTASISWKEGGNVDSSLEFRAQMRAYFMNEAKVAETEKIIYATDDARKAATGAKK